METSTTIVIVRRRWGAALIAAGCLHMALVAWLGLQRLPVTYVQPAPGPVIHLVALPPPRHIPSPSLIRQLPPMPIAKPTNPRVAAAHRTAQWVKPNSTSLLQASVPTPLHRITRKLPELASSSAPVAVLDSTAAAVTSLPVVPQSDTPAPPVSTPSLSMPEAQSITPLPVAPQETPAPTTGQAPSGASSGGGGSIAGGYGQVGATSGAGAGAGAQSGGPAEPFRVGVGAPSIGAPRHVVYVLDVSLSMTSRINRARDELSGALLSLGPDESFDIEVFGERTIQFAHHLVPADQADIGNALRFLAVQPLMEGTNLDDAIKRALWISGVNQVVVITDGVPTVGETNFVKIADHVRQYNRKPRARIDTVGLVGKNPDGTDDSFEASNLLQQIARDSGGRSTLATVGVVTPD